MKLSFLRIFCLAAVLFASLGVTAQQAYGPIRWLASITRVSPTEGVVTLSATIDQGWHLYGFNLPDDGPRPTVINFDNSQDVSFQEPIAPERPALQVRDEMFEMDLEWWDADVKFSLPFTITGSNPQIKGTISFMGCNDQTCQPPTTINIDLPVPAYVEEAAAPACPKAQACCGCCCKPKPECKKHDCKEDNCTK